MGRNMFGGGPGPWREQVRSVEAPGVTHITYRVVKDPEGR
jgi:hypothetical protein